MKQVYFEALCLLHMISGNLQPRKRSIQRSTANGALKSDFFNPLYLSLSVSQRMFSSPLSYGFASVKTEDSILLTALRTFKGDFTGVLGSLGVRVMAGIKDIQIATSSK